METDTCPITLLHGEKPAAAKLCKKYISKALLVAVTLHEKEPRHTLITVARPTAVHQLCLHGSSQPVQWVLNATELVVPASCYLQAGGAVTYLAHAPPEVVVASEGDHWKPEDIFSEELPAVKKQLFHLNITKDKMLLLKPHHKSSNSTPVWLWPSLGVVIILFSAVLIDLAARYCCLVKKRLRACRAEPAYEMVDRVGERRQRNPIPAERRRAPTPPPNGGYVNPRLERQ
jgi:hypothetical protein